MGKIQEAYEKLARTGNIKAGDKVKILTDFSDSLFRRENPVVKIGKMTISEFSLPPDETVWIDHEDGGGMQVNKKLLSGVLEQFFKDNF